MAELGSVLTPLLSAVSTGSGLYNSYENQKYQDMLRSYASNPQKLQQYAQGFTQPLQAGLSQGVNNQAQAYAAERGLSSSPQLEQQIENQAIAPYIQQNQTQGFQEALQALGLGGGATPNTGMSSLGSGLQGLTKLLPSGGGGNPLGGLLFNIGNQGGPVATDPGTFDPGLLSSVPTPTLDMTNFSFGG